MRESRENRVERFQKALHDDSRVVDIIPSKKDQGIFEQDREELVGPYCRVSTFSEQQVESYELQRAYYEEYVGKHPNWTLVDVYADEGISATSMKNRKDFLRLIDDCKTGKVTKIVTKSVSRFARNVVDALATIRMLRNLNPAVGVFFELEGIDSLAPDADTKLSLLAAFAESESINRSIAVKWGIRGRFARHIPRVCDVYGFTLDRETGQFAKHPVEGAVVRYMYDLLFLGLTPVLIAQDLTSLHIPTPTQRNEAWSASTVGYILSNEKYCGDVAMQKTVRVDIFTHKSVKNDGIERKYLIRDHHDGFISRREWEKAQAILRNFSIRDFYAFVGEELEVEGTTFYLLDCSKHNLEAQTDTNIANSQKKEEPYDESATTASRFPRV